MTTMPPLGPGQTFGDVATGPAPGATLSVHTAGHRLPFHEHAGAYACVVLSGSFLERGAIGEAECRAGDIIVHPSGERHADDFGGGGALCLNLQLAELDTQPAARRADVSILRAADELAAEIAKGACGDRLVADSLIAELSGVSGRAHERCAA